LYLVSCQNRLCFCWRIVAWGSVTCLPIVLTYLGISATRSPSSTVQFDALGHLHLPPSLSPHTA
jgi:hypothetical protein